MSNMENQELLKCSFCGRVILEVDDHSVMVKGLQDPVCRACCKCPDHPNETQGLFLDDDVGEISCHICSSGPLIAKFSAVNDIIEQIKDTVDIVDVIGEHVELKRSGGEFRGLCPFHDERRASFGVNPSKGAFFCFGCGSGGSVIRFVQDFHNLTRLEAIKQLAKDYGIPFDEEL